MVTAPVAGILPEELVLEIFFRIPARYLFGLRLICKSWNALISDPRFASTHFDHNNTHQILFMGYCQRLRRKSLSSFCLNQQPHNLFDTSCPRPPRMIPDFIKNPSFSEFFKDCLFAGSINGIICLSSSFYHCAALWNPAINHWKVISFPPAKPADNAAYTSISLAFDSLTNDYNIIRLVSLHTKPVPQSRIQIYSSNQDSWIHVDTPISFVTTRLNSSVIVRGVPYWSRNYLEVDGYHCYQSKFIGAIDPHTGLFKKIQYPSVVKNPFTHVLPFNSMDSLGVLIYLPTIYPNKKFHVYTLDQTCATWNKMYTITPTLLQNKNMCILRCFEDAGNTIVVGWDYDHGHGRSFLYDPKHDSLCRSIGMDAFRPKWGECYHHVDTLFSINGMEPIPEEEDNGNHETAGPSYWPRQLGPLI